MLTQKNLLIVMQNNVQVVNLKYILFTINSTTVIEIYMFELSNWQPTKIVIFLQSLNEGLLLFDLEILAIIS